MDTLWLWDKRYFALELKMNFEKQLAITNDNLDNYCAEQPHGAAGFAKLHKGTMFEGKISLKIRN